MLAAGYDVRRLLNYGACSKVYEVADLRTSGGGTLAFKRTRGSPARCSTLRERACFLHFQLLPPHPNLLRAHKVLPEQREAAGEGAMQQLCGFLLPQAVGDWQERSGTATAEQRLAAMLGAARGLAHMHEHGYLHGDVKPENLLVMSDGRACLADFGNSGPASTSRASSWLAGATATYSDPTCWAPPCVGSWPLVRHSLPFTAASDIWSLGVTILYIALDGDLPDFPSDGKLASLLVFWRSLEEARFAEVLRRQRVFAEGRRADLFRLIRRMLCADPSQRICASEVAGDQLFRRATEPAHSVAAAS